MMLQDIAPHKLNNQYDPSIRPTDRDYVMIFEGRQQVLADTRNGWLHYPKVEDLPGIDRDRLFYLFSVDEERYFLCAPGYHYDTETLHSDGESKAAFISGQSDRHPGRFTLCDMKQLRETETPPKYRVYAMSTGKHLADWYRDVQYCGRCGSPMEHSETERAMTCPHCHYTAYPRIMPAVIVGVINGDRLLVTRYRVGYNHNALIAGFTEIGETLEETVAREVMEEAGIRVKNIRYYKSQPWGIAGDILAGYYCEVDGDDTIRMQESELKYAQWVKREDIILQPDESSLTNEMMKHFKDSEI